MSFNHDRKHRRRAAPPPGLPTEAEQQRLAARIAECTEELQQANNALAAEVAARIASEGALKFLAETSVALAESLDSETTLSRVAKLAVPDFAHWCLVDLICDDGAIKRVEVAHEDPQQAALAAQLKVHAFDLEDNTVGESAPALVRRRSVLVESLTEAVIVSLIPDEAHRQVMRATAIQSLLAVPLVARGRTLGSLTFGRTGDGKPYGPADLAIAEQLAHRAVLSLENARLYLEATQKSASLQAANRTKDAFLAMLGHELRNPLSPILTALQLMRMRGDQAPFTKEHAIIERQTRHLMRLVDDLLDVSRITRGKIVLDRKPLEIVALVAKAIETTSPLLEERGHRLTTRVQGSNLYVDADEDRLTQVIFNLLSNAAKYTPPGGTIRISVACAEKEVVVAVKDNGLGIDPKLLPHIFDQFVQGRMGLDRSEGGLGLGLAIVRSLVELHGGRVGARSGGPGKGSEFMVGLPLSASRTETSSTRPAGPPLKTGSARARRILVVDDNRDAAETLVEALQEQGHLARAAFDGPMALRLARELKPDLALLDIGLPVMDGYELGLHLRELPDLAGIRLIALTGYGQTADRERTRQLGFDRHLVKPVDFDDLWCAIEQALSATGSGSQAMSTR